MQLFDMKTKYQFQTTPGVDRYNMPLYTTQTGSGGESISMYPVYQGFLGPAYVNGVPVAFQTQKQSFFNLYPNIVQNLQAAAVGDGGPSYTIQIPIVSPTSPQNPPFNSLVRGHVDISGIIATGSNTDPYFGTTINTAIPVTSIDAAVFITSLDAQGNSIVVTDSGQFLYDGAANQANYGLLMQPGRAPSGNVPLAGGYSVTSNTINYSTGTINVRFNQNIPVGNNINVQCYYFQGGLPRSILFYNNTLTLRSPPAYSYLVELDAYLSPAAFLASSAALPFGYMAEYIARGAARKILSDTGDIEQFMFYEPLFQEQELLVWKRSQRQWTSTRTETIYSQGPYRGYMGTGFGTGAL